MKNSKQNKIPTFIEQFKISPKLCDDMVTYFNSNKTRHAVGEVGEHHIQKHIKDIVRHTNDIVKHIGNVAKT